MGRPNITPPWGIAALLWLALSTVEAAAAPPAATPPDAGAPAPAGSEAGTNAAELVLIVPPRLLHDEGVAYPPSALTAGFHERVEVLLTLTLDVSGKVQSAELTTPRRDAFDVEAERAARALRFEPPRRGDTPVAARISYRYVFEPPAGAVGGRVVDATSGEPVSGASVAVAPDAAPVQQLTTGADGTFRLSPMSPGEASVRIESALHEPQQLRVELTPGQGVELLVRLAPRVAKAPEAGALEIVVRGERTAPGVMSYTREEVRRMPGAFGDPFRAVEALPGVTPISSGLPYFYVRGAPPGNVGYFLDRVRVPYLYHIGLGPSVIHPGLVQRVDSIPEVIPLATVASRAASLRPRRPGHLRTRTARPACGCSTSAR